MKKLCFLSGMIILGVAGINASQRLTEEQRQKIEQVQWGKITRQQELARPAVYKMIDPLITVERGNWNSWQDQRIAVNWQAVFNILDSMRGVINVNEYGIDFYNYPLIWIAVFQGNLSAAKTLLEKYRANPNRLVDLPFIVGSDEEEAKPMSPLMLARDKGNKAMVDLLIKYGAR